MRAIFRLPYAPRSAVHVGKVFIRHPEHGLIWKNRIFDLTDPKDLAAFNAEGPRLCVKGTIYDCVPVPFIFAAPAAALPAPASTEEPVTTPEPEAPESKSTAAKKAPAKKAVTPPVVPAAQA